ncbi:hypothetical protein INR49_022617, partial [Caranx melampygus]
MLMPKKNRIAIYEPLFKEGVMVAKKDVHLAKHPELADKNVPNINGGKTSKGSEISVLNGTVSESYDPSLKSCGHVKEQFAWHHFYWYLTSEGIQYLRDFLYLPLRSRPPPCAARPALRPQGPGPGPGPM